MTAQQLVLPEKTIFDVLRDIWRSRVYMFVFIIIFMATALVFITFSQKFYKAEMIIAPATPMGQGMQNSARIGEGSIQVQHEDLQSTASFLRFEHIYNGVSVASILLQDKEIISALEFDRNFEFSKTKRNWTVEQLSEYLKKRVKLEPVNGTPLRRLTYMHPDKRFAYYIIKRVYQVSDQIIRDAIFKQANGRIIYLNKSLAATTNTGHRENLTSLLMEQERLKMMVSLDQPYAATIIEKPFVYSSASYPDPYVIYPIFLFVGMFLGFITYGLRHHND